MSESSERPQSESENKAVRLPRRSHKTDTLDLGTVFAGAGAMEDIPEQERIPRADYMKGSDSMPLPLHNAPDDMEEMSDAPRTLPTARFFGLWAILAGMILVTGIGMAVYMAQHTPSADLTREEIVVLSHRRTHTNSGIVNHGPIRPDTTGVYNLLAVDATIHGKTAKVETAYNIPDIAHWTDMNDAVSWNVSVPKEGDYIVVVEYSCAKGNDGSTYKVAAGKDDEGVIGAVSGTNIWSNFKIETLLGMLHLHAGNSKVWLVPQTMPQSNVMALRRVILKPASKGS